MAHNLSYDARGMRGRKCAEEMRRLHAEMPDLRKGMLSRYQALLPLIRRMMDGHMVPQLFQQLSAAAESGARHLEMAEKEDDASPHLRQRLADARRLLQAACEDPAAVVDGALPDGQRQHGGGGL